MRAEEVGPALQVEVASVLRWESAGNIYYWHPVFGFEKSVQLVWLRGPEKLRLRRTLSLWIGLRYLVYWKKCLIREEI
jgi:hypothetical protein